MYLSFDSFARKEGAAVVVADSDNSHADFAAESAAAAAVVAVVLTVAAALVAVAVVALSPSNPVRSRSLCHDGTVIQAHRYSDCDSLHSC